MMPDSFTFNGVDMRKEWGLMVITYDLLLPQLRPRKVTIPARDGAYDFGAAYYDERTLRIDCDALGTRKTREALRELAFALSGKGRIVLWDEPDKFYTGRIYNPVDLNYVFMVGHTFSLKFVCDPFAYGDTYDGEIPDRIDYRGSARTPARIALTNIGMSTINGVNVRIRDRRG